MRRLILTFLTVAPFIAILIWPWSILGAIGVLALSHALVLYPTLRPNVQWLGPVMTCFEPEGKEVWLTVDDGPSEDTPQVLDLFDTHNVKATFFVKGVLAQSRPEMIREMIRRGHTVENHSHTHPGGYFWCLPPAKIAAQVEDCNNAIAAITGAPPSLFRAPVGLKNPGVHPALNRLNMKLAGWTARAFDTKTNDPEKVVRRIMPDIKPGTIILLHQGLRSSPQMLARVIEEVQANGYRFVIPEPARLKTKR
jgi:peptidoglycan/xylan/chitin deacetylase (PgdA/CDA1 family)